MDVQGVAAFFGEAHPEIANAEALLTGRILKSFDGACAGFGQAVNGAENVSWQHVAG